MGRRRAGLSDEERTLWAQVARSVVPLKPAAPLPPARAEGAAAPHAVPASLRPDSHPPLSLPAGLRIGQVARPAEPVTRVHDPAPTPAQRLAAHPLRMDIKTHRQLTRGKLRPEARIDLHGMTLAVAKAELTGFILSAQAAGRRLVLVITGKGKGDHGPLPTRAGALRHEVPHWLHMAPLAQAVLQIVPAHLRHGGEGAYYVWLRRSR